MEKIIDFQKTVYELCKEDPFVIEIMKELGFEQITKQGMLQTAGQSHDHFKRSPDEGN